MLDFDRPYKRSHNKVFGNFSGLVLGAVGLVLAIIIVVYFNVSFEQPPMAEDEVRCGFASPVFMSFAMGFVVFMAFCFLGVLVSLFMLLKADDSVGKKEAILSLVLCLIPLLWLLF